MARNYFGRIDLTRYVEITNAVAAALDVPPANLIGREFFFNVATLQIFLVIDEKHRYVASLTSIPADPDPEAGGLTPAQLAALAKAHVQGTDLGLAAGTPDAVTAADLRGGLESVRQSVESGEPLTSGRVVRLVGDVAFVVGSDEDEILSGQLAVTLQATASAGMPLRVALLGSASDTSFNFAPGAIYVGASGQLVQADPGAPNHYVIAGQSRGGDSLLFNPSVRVARN